VTFSSACFACFVKFFADYLQDFRNGCASPEQQAAFSRAVKFLDPPVRMDFPLLRGPFRNEADLLNAMEEARKGYGGLQTGTFLLWKYLLPLQ
jgi:hypothetical protein